jgi:hypothetical protein
MASTYPIESDAVRRLSKLIEESTRATSESVKYFVEPTPRCATERGDYMTLTCWTLADTQARELVET